ncbi:hypothetical protein [Pseudomonas sp. BN607]|uniref:hypothetical protein n=1 Tax=Pseudomonas sp. BN607 TaxID=2567895 RepID=UPI002458AC81|nr:hypothetical protein [Pseudomonas sp. BN607]MDH4552744.1 hypothetical protein [Pseudomonas sp. BN607]
MVKLNRVWWQHLAPKTMHRRLGEVEKLISNWCTTAYGQHWLKVARDPAQVMRLLPGDSIPVVHLIALGDRPIVISPQRRVRLGHRFFGANEFASRRPLAENEVAVGPLIQLDVVTDQALIQPALKMQRTGHVQGVESPSIVFSIPAHYLLSPLQWPDRAYVLYQHIFGMENSYPDDGFFYVGITKRRWQTRWAEHMRAVEKGSRLAFHRKFREERALGQITYVHHKVMAITDDLEKLYNTEKFLIEGHWLDLRRLNMIPGGKAGLRYLREHSIVRKGEIVSPDEREGVLGEWLSNYQGKNLPLMSLGERWQDEAWAAAQICSRSDRLSVAQIAAIRELAGHFQPSEIAERTGASHQQIASVISGKTYARVR